MECREATNIVAVRSKAPTPQVEIDASVLEKAVAWAKHPTSLCFQGA